MQSMMGESLTIPDAARLCQVHETTIRRRIAAGKLRFVREGGRLRVLEEDLERADVVGTEETADGEKGRRPFTEDDPIFQLIGIADGLEPADDSFVSAVRKFQHEGTHEGSDAVHGGEPERVSRRQERRPLTEDDPIFRLFGIADGAESPWTSSHTHEALAEAYLKLHHTT